MLGVVNLFADIVYEGGASVNGPFLGSLGASAAAVSVIAGFGEFLGYGLRLGAGYVADRTGRYWLVTFVGYAINVLVVPVLAFTGSLPVAAALVIGERVGRALRKPTIEAMLSYTTGTLGRGWVYAVNTALDETGATLGPLLMAWVLARHAGYRDGYLLLTVPALLALVALVVARLVFPLPERFETSTAPRGTKFSATYWLIMIAGGFFAAGLMSFELISLHLAITETVTGPWLPALLAIATLGGVLTSLILGRLFDRIGMPAVMIGITFSAAFSPLVFFGGFAAVLAGLMLWGVGYAVQDTLFKALIAGELPEGKRNVAFGLFYLGYGSGWFAGSVVTGLLYDRSRTALVVFSVVMQLVALALFAKAARGRCKSPGSASPSAASRSL
ncbi:MAG TPA: MFS transporter [Myxococcota bacterium]|nr:MFS transporter [Myxococcota bacterium]